MARSIRRMFVPRVFHYVTSEEMYFIDYQWYECENHV